MFFIEACFKFRATTLSLSGVIQLQNSPFVPFLGLLTQNSRQILLFFLSWRQAKKYLAYVRDNKLLSRVREISCEITKLFNAKLYRKIKAVRIR